LAIAWGWIFERIIPDIFDIVGAVIAIVGVIVLSILWGMLIDKKKPDRYEIIGSFIVLAGAVIIYYAPRSN
jgi:drug/metabolite transporter superfamily protein YnfA